MRREPVDSSNIDEIGYEPASATLEILFKNGGVYQYFDVPEHIYEELRRADSVGRYFSQEVRGVFRFARV